MNETIFIKNEDAVAGAFSEQSNIFDECYKHNSIISYKRLRVREHVMKLLPESAYILELNAGTGDDAIFFASNGYKVHATDISMGMQQQLIQKIKTLELEGMISHERRSYTDLGHLTDRGPYDLVFSNFAGLNCTNELDKVLSSFNHLLKPGGIATMVVLPKFCLWEFLLLFKGKWKTAFRRFSGKKGARARVEGNFFRCWYYNPSFIKKEMQKDYEWVGTEGLCTIVPPSYIEGFAEKYPRLYEWLKRGEAKFRSRWPWRNIGDYYIISFRKK